MAIQPNVYVSSQDYLVLKRQAAYKSEYIAGTMVAMSGAAARSPQDKWDAMASQPARPR